MSEFWQNRPTFITGATGLVGSWLVDRLVELNADVVCLVRDWVPQSRLINSHTIDQVRVVRGDIADQVLIERILGEYEIDTVFHLAAQTVAPIANRNPISTFQSNIAGTWTLLEACRRSPMVKQIVVASSDKAYGAQPNLPYKESTPLQGLYPYDVSKASADLIAQSYAATYNLPVTISRCGNFFGGGDLNWNRLVPGTIRSVLQGQRPIVRSDGKFIRDYFYVEEGVAAYILLAEQMVKTPDLHGEAFNFSNQIQVDVITLVNKIISMMDSTLEPDVRNEATNEIRMQYLNATKAMETLNWHPSFTLEEGLRLTIDWYKTYFDQFDK